MRVAPRWLGLLLAAVAAGCENLPTFEQASATLPQLPAGEARIFLYRDLAAYQSLAWDPIFFNGKNIGAVGPGQVILRDVAPGTYKIEPKSEGLWPDQAKTVRLSAGDVVYAKVETFTGLDPVGNTNDLQDTFVVVIVDPALAQRAIASLHYRAD